MNNNIKIKISKEEKSRIRITKKILNAKNKTVECLKLGIAKSTYYFWRNKYLKTGRVKFESKKPLHSPKTITDEKIVKFVERFYKNGRGIKYIAGKIVERFEEGKLKKVIGTSAVKGIVKRLGIYKNKKPIIKKRYDKNKYTETIKNAGEVIQIDTKYAPTNKGWAYQMTAIDLKTRFTWTQIYDDRSQMSAKKFLDYVVPDCPFKIQTIQTDNGSEFINFSDTDKLSQFELGCEKYNIALRHIPVGQPRFNGCVERVHGTFEREFYQKNPTNLSLEKLKIKLERFTRFYNTKRLHSKLKYCTIIKNLKILGLPIPISVTS